MTCSDFTISQPCHIQRNSPTVIQWHIQDFAEGATSGGLGDGSLPAGSGALPQPPAVFVILWQIQSILKHPLMGKKTSNQLSILNTQTVACLRFGKGGKLRGSGDQSGGQKSPVWSRGAWPWQGVCMGDEAPQNWSTFSIFVYMKFSCHVTAVVTKNAVLLERNTNEIE